MSRLHITTRIAHAATAPLVRKTGPKVAKTTQQALQFIGFLALGGIAILAAAIAHANGIPWPLIKSVSATSSKTPACTSPANRSNSAGPSMAEDWNAYFSRLRLGRWTDNNATC